MATVSIRSPMVSPALKVFLCVIFLPVLYFLVELVRVVKLRILKVSTTPVDVNGHLDLHGGGHRDCTEMDTNFAYLRT